MNVIKAKFFEKDYKKLTREIQQRIKKSLQLLAENSHHPSLRVKKTKGKIFKDFNNVFEGRITKDYRFFFLMQDDVFTYYDAVNTMNFFKNFWLRDNLWRKVCP